MNILITGATGNIGKSVLHFLMADTQGHQVFAGVRDIERAKKSLPYQNLQYREFDFESASTYAAALRNIDCVFLLRPPHIADVKKVFYPLIRAIRTAGISKIVFLSVQGVDQSPVIPHHQIEKCLTLHQLPFISLRPSYFMQNLTTTLLQDIRELKKIVLPAGKALFNWVDIENIGEIAAKVIIDYSQYENRKIEITGPENRNFADVCQQITAITGKSISYQSLNPLSFFFYRKKRGTETAMILVMIMLHFLPRFSKPPVISHSYTEITGKKPNTLQEFIAREKQLF